MTITTDQPHRRHNPLTDEWILVSPQRTERPWQGQIEAALPELRPSYDPQCYLCPGNERAGGNRNPIYEGPFVFTNDFSALLPQTPPSDSHDKAFLRMQSVQGTCRVICFSPQHDLTLPQMSLADIRGVIDVWAAQYVELAQTYRWVQIFENKGAIMGCSNPHPHGQIWASDRLPNEPAKEDRNLRTYYLSHRSNLLLDYLQHESVMRDRTVVENEHWLVVVPFWALWPYETLLLPRRHVLRMPDLTVAERNALASILKRLLIRYDNLFHISFPYSMGWHNAPNSMTTEEEMQHWLLHAHFYPPLLRSATVKKFMVGYEMLAEPQRDLTAEQAAARLRAQSELRFA